MTNSEKKKFTSKYKELRNSGGGVFKNSKSGKHSLVIHNNVKEATSGKPMVLFRPLTQNPRIFAMERDVFYSEFEEVEDNIGANILIDYVNQDSLVIDLNNI